MCAEILYDIVLLEGDGADLYFMRSANFWQDFFGQHDPEIILRQANPENCPFGGSLKAPINGDIASLNYCTCVVKSRQTPVMQVGRGIE